MDHRLPHIFYGDSRREHLLPRKPAVVAVHLPQQRHDAGHPDRPAAPFGVNQIVHRSNARLERDLEIMVRHRVPICVTSLGARTEVYEAVRSYGGITLHDVINNRFARKAIEKGADGLIAVAAGAGGHAGLWSPFALVQEIRQWFDGPLVLRVVNAAGSSLVHLEALDGAA